MFSVELHRQSQGHGSLEPASDPPPGSLLPIDLSEVTSSINGSKTTTSLLDPIPTKRFKDVFPLIEVPVLDQINLSSFKFCTSGV